MYRWVNGVVFVDAGNIFAKGEDWNGLKVGYGFGLRFDTPVGLLRGDVGFPSNESRAAPKKPGSTSASGTSSSQAEQVQSAVRQARSLLAARLLPLAYLIVRRIATTADRSGASGARRRNASKCSAVFGSWRWR